MNPATADFSKMGQSIFGGSLFIARVLQKTSISLDENGTSVAAATIVDMEDESVRPDPDEIPVYYVTLDRPFVYAIVDNATGLPLFIGVVEQV